MKCPECKTKMIYHATQSGDDFAVFVCSTLKCDGPDLRVYHLTPVILKTVQNLKEKYYQEGFIDIEDAAEKVINVFAEPLEGK